MKHLAACIIALLSYAPAYAEELVIVSPHWEGIRYEFGRRFEEHYELRTGKQVKIKWMDVGGTAEIVRYLKSQFQLQPDGVGIDLVFGGGIDPFINLKQAGMLAPLELTPNDLKGIATSVAGIPLHDPERHYFSPTMAAFGIICNREVLSLLKIAAPESWEDLGRPPFRSWIGSADPRGSGSVHMVYEIILQAHGWEAGWQVIYRLGANIRSFVSSSAQVSKDVANGEIACGLAIDTQATSLVQTHGGDQISFIVPDGISVVNGDAVALVKGAPNAKVALEFARFLFSEPGQKLWYARRGAPGGPEQYDLARLPVMPALYSSDLPSNVALNPFKLKGYLKYDFELGSRRWSLVNELLRAFVVNNHERLRVAVPTAPPISNAEQHALIATESSMSPIEKAQLLHSWEVKAAQGHEQKKNWYGVVALGALLSLAFIRRRWRR